MTADDSSLELACASLECWEAAVTLMAGIPVCADHRRLFGDGAGLPRARYVPQPGRPWFVYYITWEHEPGIVKIGATHNLVSRLTGLRRGGHYPQLLVAEPGTGELETERHEQFEALCLGPRSEYFRREPPLDEHIDALKLQYPDQAAMLGDKLPWWMNPRITVASFSEMPRCGGPCLDHDRPCGRPAGWGTDHFGTGACRHHEHIPAGQAADAADTVAAPREWMQAELFAA